MKEAAFDLLLFVGTFYLYLKSRQFPRVGAEQYTGVGAGFWPGIVLLVMMLTTATSTVWNFATAIKARRRQPPEPSSGQGEGGGLSSRSRSLTVRLAVAVLLTLYVLAIPYAGFMVATTAFLAVTMVQLGERHWKVWLPLSLAITISFAVLFARVFFIALPRGTGIFAEVSGFFY